MQETFQQESRTPQERFDTQQNCGAGPARRLPTYVTRSGVRMGSKLAAQKEKPLGYLAMERVLSVPDIRQNYCKWVRAEPFGSFTKPDSLKKVSLMVE